MSHKSEMAGPFNRGDTIINKHFTLLLQEFYDSVFVLITVMCYLCHGIHSVT